MMGATCLYRITLAYITLYCLFEFPVLHADLKKIRNQVLRVYPTAERHLLYIHQLEGSSELDFWTRPRFIGVPVDIRAPDYSINSLKNDFESEGISSEIWIANVEELINNSTAQNFKARKENIKLGNDGFTWNTYHTYNEITTWMNELETNHPESVQCFHVGFSYEGRVMKGLKLHHNNHRQDKPIVWIDGGTHGREWISPAVVTYIINELVENDTYQYLLEDVDFMFVPVTNPDGYAFTFTEDGRLWSKTRSRYSSLLKCRGVNMDTNWGYHWEETFLSPCHQDFPGYEPFSEAETRHIRSQIWEMRKNIGAYLSFFSYSQIWMYPWGYTTDWTRNYVDIDTLAASATSALETYRGTRYLHSPMCLKDQTCMAGSSIDWAKGIAAIKYSYHVELPDRGNYGFLLPPSEIVPAGEETLKAVIEVARKVIEEFENKD